MKQKTLTIDCQNDTCTILANIIANYAQAAFPKGGSECAQASREALEMTAHGLQQTAQVYELKIRQRAILKSAIKWYFSEIEQNHELKSQLLDLLNPK